MRVLTGKFLLEDDGSHGDHEQPDRRVLPSLVAARRDRQPSGRADRGLGQPDEHGPDASPVRLSILLHPKVKKDIAAIHPSKRSVVADRIESLASGERHSSTHPLAGMPGWSSTHADPRHIVVHRTQGDVLHVGYVGAQHDYEQARRRLSIRGLVLRLDSD
jgi:hypothetical protein